MSERLTTRDRRSFHLMPFGDDHKPHEVWESREYKRLSKKDIFPDNLTALEFPDTEFPNQVTITGKLTDGKTRFTQYEEKLTVADGKTMWNISTSYNGVLVREVRAVIPQLKSS